ncbi:MAG: methyltransferase domain-containing protein [Desulfovibrionaceae bacterium]
MSYEWIDIQALPPLEPGMRLVLFGAGNGSRELLKFLEESRTDATAIAILDNDPSLQGRDMLGLPVCAPAELDRLNPDMVIVTTVSGRDAVADQLRAMGREPGRDFALVGTFPTQGALINLERLLLLDREYDLLGKGGFLHVGPGGFLGLECGLFALTGKRAPGCALAIDAYDFRMRWPDVTESLGLYARSRAELPRLAAEFGVDAETALTRWDALFLKEEGRCRIDPERIALRFPHRFSALPVENQSLSLACSFAVLEHVNSPQNAVNELWRVLKPGGCAVQTIVTRDHRSFGSIKGHTPISYRMYSEEQWTKINENTFPQNRVAPFQWREIFEARGFQIRVHEVLSQYEPSEEELALLHSDFQHWSPDQQRQVDCCIVAVKP